MNPSVKCTLRSQKKETQGSFYTAREVFSVLSDATSDPDVASTPSVVQPINCHKMINYELTITRQRLWDFTLGVF